MLGLSLPRAFKLLSFICLCFGFISFNFLCKFIFNWRIIALQYCIGFCHIPTRISHRHAYVPTLLILPPSPLGCHRAPDLSSCVIEQISTGCVILHMEMCMLQCYSLNLPHFPTISASLFSKSVSPLLPCK